MRDLTEKVTKRLLAGAEHLRTPDAELVAQDMASRASEELCRAHTEVRGETRPGLLCDLDIAAPRWAGVDSYDHSTWVMHRGDRAA